MIRKPDGSTLYVGMDSIATGDAEGRLNRCNMTFRDISDLKKYEELVRFETALNNLALDAVIATDKDLNIIA